MAAYRRVDDLRADCLYTGISSGPNVRYRVWEAFTFTFSRDEAKHRVVALHATPRETNIPPDER